MKRKIYITRKLPNSVVDYLAKHCEVKMWQEEDVPVPREVLEHEIKEVDGLLCMLTEQVDKSLIHMATNLKVISTMAVGFNNIDISYAASKGIFVTNTPGVLTETTADLTFALLMATARRLGEAESFLRDGHWKTWSPMLLTGQDIHGSSLGIIGLGRIGEALARRAIGFNMTVSYYNRTCNSEAEAKLGVTYKSLEQLLSSSDFICVMTPFTPETEDLLSYEEFSLMKENAILINTARGGIVNEAALYDALLNKKIWGAGLDVFEEEPVRTDHPLLTLPNVVAIPHIGSASIKTRMKMAKLAADNLLKELSGNKTSYRVNQ